MFIPGVHMSEFKKEEDFDLGIIIPSCFSRCNVCKNKNKCDCLITGEDKFEPVSLEELKKRINEYYYKNDCYENKVAGAMRAAAEEHNYQGVFMAGYAAALEDFAAGHHK